MRTAVVQDAAGSHQCNECGYKKYIGHFKQHRKSTHEGVRHSCDQCDYKGTSKSHLTSHVKSIHEGVHCTTHVINVITRQQELDISTVIN